MNKFKFRNEYNILNIHQNIKYENKTELLQEYNKLNISQHIKYENKTELLQEYNIIIYSLFNRNNYSGGLSIIRILLEKIKLYLPDNIYFCPLIEDIPELNFYSSFRVMKGGILYNKPLENITDDEFKSLFSTEFHPFVVTHKVLSQKNNIVIYPEDIIGNPLKQTYVVRWLLFFPNENPAKNYDYNNDLILFYDYSYYNLYKYLCKDLNIKDYLTDNIKNPKYFKIMRFEIDKFKDYKLTRNGTCSTVRKSWPPYTFCDKNIRNDFFYKKIKKLNEIHTNFNFEFEDFLNDEQIIYLFNIKEKFISYDLFTFYLIQSALCGCVSIMNTIPSISAEELYKDPCYKYGISYGEEFIDYAKKTMKYVRNYQYYLYYSSEINFINLFKYIEEHFKINLNINYNSIDNKNQILKKIYYKNQLDFQIILDKINENVVDENVINKNIVDENVINENITSEK